MSISKHLSRKKWNNHKTSPRLCLFTGWGLSLAIHLKNLQALGGAGRHPGGGWSTAKPSEPGSGRYRLYGDIKELSHHKEKHTDLFRKKTNTNSTKLHNFVSLALCKRWFQILQIRNWTEALLLELSLPVTHVSPVARALRRRRRRQDKPHI